MNTISRYIFLQILGSFVLTLTTLIGIVWLSQALQEINLVMSQGQTLGLFLLVTTLALPSLVVVIAPVALLIAILYVLNRLNSDSELVIVTAAGASRFQIIVPVMAMATLVMLMTGLLSTVIQPDSLRQIRHIITQVNADVISSMAQEGRFTDVQSLTLHIRQRGADGSLEGLMLHDPRDQTQITTYLAERGRISREDDSAFLVMENGSLQRRGTNAQDITVVAFDRYVYDLSNLLQSDGPSHFNVRERPTRDLLLADTTETYFVENKGRFRAELHERFSSMLYSLAFAAIALATVGFARTTRQTRTEAVVWCVFAVMAVRFAGFAAGNLSRQDAVAVAGVYGIPLVTTAFALLAAFGYARWVTRLHDWIVARLPLEAFRKYSGYDRLEPIWRAWAERIVQRLT
jgi:lipopolysaccharide export system permease protein